MKKEGIIIFLLCVFTIVSLCIVDANDKDIKEKALNVKKKEDFIKISEKYRNKCKKIDNADYNKKIDCATERNIYLASKFNDKSYSIINWEGTVADLFVNSKDEITISVNINHSGNKILLSNHMPEIALKNIIDTQFRNAYAENVISKKNLRFTKMH